MNQPCYNSIALARYQHEVDRQEAKENFIAAAVDRLMDDRDWLLAAVTKANTGSDYKDWQLIKSWATEQASREYQQHLSALEQARIDGMVSE